MIVLPTFAEHHGTYRAIVSGSHSFFPRSNFSHANNFKRVRPEEASAQGILTQPSVNETAAKLMMRCGRKEQKVLQSVSATEGERRAESQKYLSRALLRA